MERRQFLKLGPGLLCVIATAHADQDGVILRLQALDVANQCQSVENGERAQALAEVNPMRYDGVLASSVGCKSPHKHLLFIPARYIQNPSLIESESDGMLADGTKAKTFQTSHAFDMSEVVKLTVGAHVHQLQLTKADAEQISASPDGVKVVAYQPKLLGFGQEPGHVFQLKLPVEQFG